MLTEHGVQIAPSTYYAAKTRPPSARTVRDERVLTEIHRLWTHRELGRGPFRTVDDLELATLSWVHSFNHNRLHSSIRYATPVEHETTYYRHSTAPQQPLPRELSLH